MIALYGIIGDPVAHSLSPAMQNRAFQAAGLAAVYLPFHVRPAELVPFVQAARRWPLAGWNVTLPHKKAMLELVDERTREAEVIGAVNCVVRTGEKLIGHNTDAPGYLQALAHGAGWEPHDKVVTLLGAGGGARAVGYALLKAGVQKIFLINRTLAKGRALAESFQTHFPGQIESLPWQEETLCRALAESDLLVNATSVGLEGSAFENLPLAALPRQSLVSDLVYGPADTPLTRQARQLGLATQNGLEMLLYQGVESFKIWTGRSPDIAVMREALALGVSGRPVIPGR